MDAAKILTKAGHVRPEQLPEIEKMATGRSIAFADAVVQMGLVSKEQVYTALSESLGIPYLDISAYVVMPECIKLVSSETAHRYRAVPLFNIQDTLTVAMEDPTNLAAVDRLRHESGKEIELCLAASEDLQDALNRYYGTSGTISKLLDKLDAETKMRKRPRLSGSDTRPMQMERTPVASARPDQPIVKLVDLMIEQAAEQGASDIHIEPEENKLRIRYRIDGVLHEVPAPSKQYESSIVSRIKVLANLDIAESRMAQDGQMRIDVKGRAMDVRVSIVSTVHGENVVLRLLDTETPMLDLKQLGFSDELRAQFEMLIQRPYGMVLETGPTGSGKTTTLYAALRILNSAERNIVTIEDPVEYKLPMVRQMQVNQKANLTFANGLRAILRQDPDIVMVGEIRDAETANIAVQAALTGHLVFSTLHTNNAAGAITRLIDMKVEPFFISSSLIGILAQRLVRCICTHCKEKAKVPKSLLAMFKDYGGEAIVSYKGKGCHRCGKTGYKGRIAILELLRMSERIQQLIVDKPSTSEIIQAARAEGMKTLLEDGVEKIKAGVTTVEEVARAV